MMAPKLMCAVTALVLAGCAGASPEPDTTDLTGSTGSDVSVSPAEDTAAASAAGTAGAAPVGDTAAPSQGTQEVAESVLVAVAGGELDRGIVELWEGAGGQLLVPDEWYRRWGDGGLPRLDDDEARIVEARDLIQVVDGGDVRRVNEVQFLVMGEAGKVADLLETTAKLVGVDQWPMVTQQVVEGGAPCETRSYTTDGDAWTILGCDFPDAEPLQSLGVARTWDEPAAPLIVDGSQPAVVTALSGVSVSSDVIFRNNGQRVTYQRFATVNHDLTHLEAVAVLEAGLLASWSKSAGDGSTQFVGPSGEAWTVSDGLAEFGFGGRW